MRYENIVIIKINLLIKGETMKIKNNERHKINKGRLEQLDRENGKKKRKEKIREARRNKQLIHDFESAQINKFLEDDDN